MPILKAAIILLSLILLGHFCHLKTDGFTIQNITSQLSFHEEWEVSPLTLQEQEKVSSILNQKFTYFTKGVQCYVFLSEDQHYVLKLFRYHHLRPPSWLLFLPLPSFLEPYRNEKVARKQSKLLKDFASYKIAYEEMKEETGLVFIHLNKTNHWQKKIQLIDKIGIAHEIDLDAMEFLLQKKADLVYPTIQNLMKKKEEEQAKKAIDSLVDLLIARSKKGIFDKDPDLKTNFGFCDHEAIQIDIGRFKKGIELSPTQEELIRITDSFNQWLAPRYPSLSEHLQERLNPL